MHVVLVSQCEKKAIHRTAKVLDAYAVRHGDRTWITPITRHGLRSLHGEIKRRATRQTAVACYVNEGSRRLRLLWTVGQKHAFRDDGSVAVASTSCSRGPSMEIMTAPVRLACLIAECAGLIHDFGKFGRIFQEKLSYKEPTSDAIRHEWISLQVLLGLLERKTWEQSWGDAILRMSDYYKHEHGFKGGLKSTESILAYLVMSHHRLPQAAAGNARDTIKRTSPGDEQYIRDASAHAENNFIDRPSPALLSRIDHLLDRIRDTLPGVTSPDGMRAITNLARMSLILADHHVSAIKMVAPSFPTDGANAPIAFANTVRQNGSRVFNQPLEWHLDNVGRESSAMVHRLMSFNPPGMSAEALDAVEMTASSQYEWQNTCAHALAQSQMKQRVPTLVFNTAGTGSGKTRMNLRAAAALRSNLKDGGRDPIRLTVAQNLRSLTLQTRDALCEHSGIPDDQVSCIIGSKIAAKLHAAGKTGSVTEQYEDDDENEIEDDFNFVGAVSDVPGWLQGFVEKRPILRPLTMSPVVVSTIDFLISAGEPHRQGNYGLANLRIMHSDLILDEVDAYDTKALLAVARLVTASATWGRNVIVSSATISKPVARVIFQAFSLGIRMRESLGDATSKNISTPSWRQAIIDDSLGPSVLKCTNDTDFASQFDSHIKSRNESLGVLKFRPAELQPVTRSPEGFLDAILQASLRMHARHAWDAPANKEGFDGKISFGLVRVANIGYVQTKVGILNLRQT